MEVQQIITIISTVASFLVVTLIPSIIALVKYVKDYKAAKTDAEKQAIYNEMLGVANNLIAAAEDKYKDLDALIKSQGGAGSGKDKKDDVMTKLQLYCTEKGISFDSDYWSAKIDEIVALTKKVNAKGV